MRKQIKSYPFSQINKKLIKYNQFIHLDYNNWIGNIALEDVLINAINRIISNPIPFTSGFHIFFDDEGGCNFVHQLPIFLFLFFIAIVLDDMLGL